MKALAHQLNQKKLAAPVFLPDFTARTVHDIDFAKLESIGVKHLLFDLDQTLRRPYSRKLPPAVITLLNEVQGSNKFKSLNLVSNNQRNLSRYSQPISAHVFQPFRKGLRLIRKPHPRFFAAVMEQLDATPEQCVMIGDRLHADVFGGNRVGMYTIYIKKRGAIDYWFDWLLLTRLREKRTLKDAIIAQKKRRSHDK